MAAARIALDELDDAALMRQIAQLVAEAADLTVDKVGHDVNLFTELEIDSLGIVMVYVEMAMAFGVPEPDPDADLSATDTVAKLAAYARAHAG